MNKNNNNYNKVINVIGAGLAGCEVSYKLANFGYKVRLFDLKPNKIVQCQNEKDLLSELVCSNSFKSTLKTNANGLLKREMELLDSLFIKAANLSRIEGSDDLVVDRNKFSSYITEKIRSCGNIELICKEIDSLDDFINKDEITVIASGPLTTDNLSNSIKSYLGNDFLSFFDAAAPLVFVSSLDTSNMIVGSKYQTQTDEGNYLNILLNKEDYYTFVKKLLESPKVISHSSSHFESCLPIEVIASRGIDSLRFGPMSPKGISDSAYAVVQLRQDDVGKTLYNFVGFQTNLTYDAQRELIQSLPGCEKAKFARFGLMHKNIYINAPSVLNRNLSLKKNKNIFVCGQISGVEGYVESASNGLLCAYYIDNFIKNDEQNYIPLSTMMGSLVNYLIMSNPRHFAPMNSSWGIFYATNKKDKEKLYNDSLELITKWLENRK